jgi:gamma-glutamylcyclotransferase (GGCT)/AIG2-like uncharacterized protein YtfP
MLRRVFVYGTLRAGHHNHHILGAARAVGKGKTVSSWRMYDLGSGFPGVVWPEAGDGVSRAWGGEGGGGGTEGYSIVGEVYEVDDAGMVACDRLEGYKEGGGGMYDRVRVQVSPLQKQEQGGCRLGGSMDAWMYTFNGGVSGMSEIVSGDWNVWTGRKGS